MAGDLAAIGTTLATLAAQQASLTRLVEILLQLQGVHIAGQVGIPVEQLVAKVLNDLATNPLVGLFHTVGQAAQQNLQKVQNQQG